MTSLLIDTHLNDIKIFLLEDGFVVDKKEVINKKNKLTIHHMNFFNKFKYLYGASRKWLSKNSRLEIMSSYF